MEQSQPQLLESLPLSLCAYPFLFLLYEPLNSFGKSSDILIILLLDCQCHS
jgi:hypothetical protein